MYDLFFPDALTRLDYFMRMMVINIAGDSLAMPVFKRILKSLSSGLCDISNIWVLAGIAYLVLLVIIWAWYSIKGLVIPRMADVGFHTGYWWIMLIPFINVVLGLFLVFIPGKQYSTQQRRSG